MAEFIITAPDGKKYRVKGATADGAKAFLKKKLAATPAAPTGHEEMTAKSIAAIEQAIAAGDSPREAAFLQGALFNYGDEMYGGIKALQSGFQEGEYTRARDQARGLTDAAVAEQPGYAIGGGLATGVPAALLTGGASLPAVTGTGALFGGAAGYGGAQENDLEGLADTGTGAAFGAAGGMAGYGVGKLLEKFLSSGLASGAIRSALNGKPAELLAKIKQMGGSAAEADGVLREVLRGQAAKNPTAAMAAVPGAQQRVTDVNQQLIDQINNLVSPENVAAFTKRTQGETAATVRPGYQATRADPTTLGLTPELSNMPGVDEAMAAAKELADFQKRPFDPTALTVEDLDVMQRFLRLSKDKAFEGTPVQTLKGPIYGESREAVNDLAKQVSPELAAAQQQVALQKSVEEATELGKSALNPGKESAEVAAEFAALGPEAQAGYRAAVASRIRAQAGNKVTNANAAGILDKPEVAEKLAIVGFPADEIEAIVQRGAAARGTVDALVGGSDTARKLAASAASESPFTKVKSGDLAAAALVHPTTLGLLPMLRSIGAQQEQKVAGLLIKALTSQDPGALRGLLARSPQGLLPKRGLGLLAGSAASQIGQPR